MFERKHETLLPRGAFYVRMGRSLLTALAIIAFSMLLGTAGYHYFGDLDWIDAVLNAAMILTGMGPVDHLSSNGGKLFSSAFALYSGIAFLTMMAVLAAPILHRMLHKFHLEDEEAEK